MPVCRDNDRLKLVSERRIVGFIVLTLTAFESYEGEHDYGV